MRISLLLLIAFSGFFSNCGTNSKTLKSTDNAVVNTDKLSYEIVTTKLVGHSEPIPTPELRIYDVNSSLDGMALMHSEFGKWSEAKEGKYQDKIQSLIWDGVVFPFSDEKFRIVVDGSETKEDFFASIIAYDFNFYLAFEESHPHRQALVNYFTTKLREVNLEGMDTSIFQKKN